MKSLRQILVDLCFIGCPVKIDSVQENATILGAELLTCLMKEYCFFFSWWCEHG